MISQKSNKIKNKKIAFDLDGVVYDMVGSLDRYFESGGFGLKDSSKYELDNRYGSDIKTTEKLLSDFGMTRPFRTMKLYKKAKKEMICLAKRNKLYIITYRDWTPHGVSDTLERIKKDQLPVKKENIIFSRHKGNEAKRLGIDIFYEDNLDNALDIVSKTKSLVILIDTPYNKIGTERIRRTSW